MNELPKEIYIVGAGGHGKVAIRAAQACGSRVVAVFDDNPVLCGQELCGAPIVGAVSTHTTHPVRPILIAVGSNSARTALAAVVQFPLLTLVHPAAIVDSGAKIGEGTLVLAGAVVQVDSMIGDQVIVNDNATIEHDCVVGDGAHVSCNACLTGGVRVGDGVLIGAGAVVLPGVRIGDFTTVGAGSVVTKDLPCRATAIGNPARIRNPVH